MECEFADTGEWLKAIVDDVCVAEEMYERDVDDRRKGIKRCPEKMRRQKAKCCWVVIV
jgi:hypothetical protein